MVFAIVAVSIIPEKVLAAIQAIFALVDWAAPRPRQRVNALLVAYEKKSLVRVNDALESGPAGEWI